MMKIRHLFIPLLVMLTFSVGNVRAQVVTSLYFMDNLPQSSILNPAFDPNYNFYLGLPLINNLNMGLSSDIGLGDIYKNGNFFWNTEQGYNAFVDALANTSFISAEFNTSLLNFGFRAGSKGYVHFAFNQRMDMRFGVPQDFFRLIDLSAPHDFSGMEIGMRMFHEYALGYSRQINDQLVVGAKVKMLAGIGAGSVVFDRFEFNTTQDEWALHIDASANISGPISVESTDGELPSIEQTVDFANTSEVIDYFLLGSGNTGFGIDLGAEYEVIPRLKLSVSLIDIGRLNWKNNVTNLNYNLDFSFGGFSDLISTGEDGMVGMNTTFVEDMVDSINNAFSSSETNVAFANTLSPKLFLAVEYELTPSLSVGALSKTRFIGEEVRQNFMVNFNANLKHVLTFGANYNVGVHSQNSFGGVLGFRLSPFYLYFAADMVPGYKPGGMVISSSDTDPVELPFTLPKDLNAVNFQFGINLLLGQRSRQLTKKQKKEVPPLYEKPLSTSSFSYPF